MSEAFRLFQQQVSINSYVSLNIDGHRKSYLETYMPLWNKFTF